MASTALYSSPVGNPAAPELLQKGFFGSCDSWIYPRMGYEGDFVADGRMEQFDQGRGRVDRYQQDTNSGTFTLDIVNRLDVYGVFGSSKTQADWRFSDGIAGTVTRIEMGTRHQFLWGAGARAILYEWGRAFLGLGGRYSSCNYRPARLASNGVVRPVRGAHCDWREWQINLDVAYKIDVFTPYIGAKYSDARMDLRDFPLPIAADLTGSNSFKNRVPVGLYVGCALSTGQYFMLNIEGRLADEEAVTVSGELRF